MIVINKTQQEVYSLEKSGLRKLQWNYDQIHDVIHKRFAKIDTKLLPHYINYLYCKEIEPWEDFVIHSFLHEKVFIIDSELVNKLTTKTIIWWLFCVNDHFYQWIVAKAVWEVYHKVSYENLSLCSIRTEKELLENSFVVSSKQTKDYWKSIAICSLRPVYTNLMKWVETIEAVWFWIDRDRKVSQEKSISESLERMMSWMLGTAIISHKDLHAKIVKLYMWDTWLLALENGQENLFKSKSILSWKTFALPWNILYYPYPGNDFWNWNSNGVGCHVSQEKAIENWLFELIERDAFMIFRLTKSHWIKINPSDKVQELINEQTYWKYESHLFLLHYDHPLPVVLTVIKREKSIVCSMWVWYTLDEAIQKSLNESGQFAVDHLNYRTEEEDDDLIVEKHIKHYLKSENFSDVERFFGLDVINYEEIQNKDRVKNYSSLLDYFKNRDADIIVHEYYHKVLDVMKRKCVRVVSDYLIPIRFWGVDKEWIYTCDRIVEASDTKMVNTTIHPFW